MKFLKIIWILSVAVIITFFMAFESFRIYDFITTNYSVKTMKISSYSYNSSSRNESITINGFIDNEDVYFSRFDNEIEELSSMYPGITMGKNKIEELSSIFPDTFKNSIKASKNIEVLKFKNSNRVMLIKDKEFERWKIHLYIYSIYSLISIIILIYTKKSKQSKN